MSAALVPLSAAFQEETAKLWGDPAVIRYTNVPIPCGRREAEARLARLLACQTELSGPVLFAVTEEGRFCGIAGCPPVDADQGRFGLFYQLLPGCWGRGLGREAARLVLDALQKQRPGAVVYADAVAENAASVRILEELGFVRTGVRPQAFCRDGRKSHILDYVRRLSGGEECYERETAVIRI